MLRIIIISFHIIVVPDPQITLTLDKPRYNVGDTAIFTCTAEIIAMNIDEDVIVAIEANGATMRGLAGSNSRLHTLMYSANFTLSSDVMLFSARPYTCNVSIVSNLEFIMPSNIVTASIDLSVISK